MHPPPITSVTAASAGRAAATAVVGAWSLSRTWDGNTSCSIVTNLPCFLAWLYADIAGLMMRSLKAWSQGIIHNKYCTGAREDQMDTMALTNA